MTLTPQGQIEAANRILNEAAKYRQTNGYQRQRMPTTQQIATARIPPTPPPQYVATPAPVPFSPAPAQYAPQPTSFTPAPVQQTYV